MHTHDLPRRSFLPLGQAGDAGVPVCCTVSLLFFAGRYNCEPVGLGLTGVSRAGGACGAGAASGILIRTINAETD